VAVLMGGRSAEREISLKSGTMVLNALKKSGVDAHAFDPRDSSLQELRAQRFERAFIALHGRFGEDGTVQGALEYLGIPYTGSGVMATAQTDPAGLASRLKLPLMVKPAREGSSIGMSKVTSVEKILPALQLAARYDDVVIAERFIEGVELTAGILAEEPLPLIRLETPREFYDYEAKYFADDTRYILPCGLPADQERSFQKLALEAFRVLGCSGWGRVDLMVDRAGHPYLLEVNTIPGMTDHSLVPMAARARGIAFEQLVVRILDNAHVG
jgi:D-alanine-D-alanine ligase